MNGYYYIGYYYIESSSFEDTALNFLDKNLINMPLKDFVDLNKDIIRQRYTPIDIILYDKYFNSNYSDVLIKPNTILIIPYQYKELESFARLSEGQVFYQKKDEIFFSPQNDLLLNDTYVRANSSELNFNSINARIMHENLSVWWYSKVLDELFDITSFVTYLSTSNGKTGSFTLSLEPTRIDLSNSKMDIDVVNYISMDSGNIGDIGVYYDYFEAYLQENDIFFLRFEELEIDKINKNRSEDYFSIPMSNLIKSPNLCLDMIGLLDTYQVSYVATGNSKTISVNGRDFSKLFIEDGSYFLPYQFIEGKDNESKFVYGGDTSSDWFKRNMITGDYNYFFSYEMKKIDDMFKFIVNHLSNLGIVKKDLFNFYGEKLAKKYKLPNENSVLSLTPLPGVWGIVNLNFDNNVLDRVVTGENLINPSGSIIGLLSSICKDPFVEIIMDTYTNEFDVTVRQPPFTEAAITDVLVNKKYITISKQDILSFDISNETEYYTYYSIEPHNQLVGGEDSLFKSIIPIINLESICYRYGNKGYIIQDPYISRVSIFGDNGKYSENTAKTLITGLLNDLLYVIESTCYLPFTRKGTITINGDRRIKANSFIYNEFSNELYYIVGASNQLSISGNQINRTTTLNIIRGMDIDHIIPKKNKEKSNDSSAENKIQFNQALQKGRYSYFDLINVDSIREKINKSLQDSNTDTKKQKEFNVKLNKEAEEYLNLFKGSRSIPFKKKND